MPFIITKKLYSNSFFSLCNYINILYIFILSFLTIQIKDHIISLLKLYKPIINVENDASLFLSFVSS